MRVSQSSETNKKLKQKQQKKPQQTPRERMMPCKGYALT